MPDNTRQADLPQQLSHPSGPLGLCHLPPAAAAAAADPVLLGDLTGRYATGSYSRLACDGRSLVLREDRQARPSTGIGSLRRSPAPWSAPAAPSTS
ncbi:hypothetical protein [Streptomyces sp. AK04-3B]|uniref:hypothetical protein n=1 Tax=Streptomyces sp. AK04-3B TaxID=3028650 RepID=UPI0029A1CE3C|nr:hypothetical protein [Streptomyces sp. AK04-3B]MDX3798096.1 hypothetical protein [Streptomyces sp. AK04-3B]